MITVGNVKTVMKCVHTFGTGRHKRQADITLLFQYMSFRNTSWLSNSMDPDIAQHFNLNLPSAVGKVYQRNSFSRQMFDAL